ncbi:hypothetical protein [Polaribacter septentrionalilitoris]|uniref:hypothetical protein n=1 Tax=Polaribacter septentrionalilitoris TaxID=2494657 RepID=UPI001358B1F3|nr:hypothetical protein [Polaribacter septentrionalilitoris]
MKKTIKNFAVVALMFGTLVSYANNKTNTTETTVGKNTVKVEFKNVKEGHILNIKNDNGEVVYKKEVKKSGTFSKIFNLSALENGNYSAELVKDFEIEIKNFEVKNGLVTFFDSNSEKIFKPVIRSEGNLIYVSKIEFNDKPLEVDIYYNDEIVLSETLKGNGNEILKRAYKLSDSKSGDYTIVINSNSRYYTKRFRK